MDMKVSKNQVDRLGDRLRSGPIVESDLGLLDDYRRSFGDAYEIVVCTIREKLKLEPTGRPAKSTPSIIEKLRRESIRLSQIQDIAGCRIIVADILEQDRVIAALGALFPGASVIDRRVNPTYGYRAVHVIPRVSEKLIEIQIRSSLQHLWAEVSEKLSDVMDPAIKYGGGEATVRRILDKSSSMVAKQESTEQGLAKLRNEAANEPEILRMDENTARTRVLISELLSEMISGWERP